MDHSIQVTCIYTFQAYISICISFISVSSVDREIFPSSFSTNLSFSSFSLMSTISKIPLSSVDDPILNAFQVSSHQSARFNQRDSTTGDLSICYLNLRFFSAIDNTLIIHCIIYIYYIFYSFHIIHIIIFTSYRTTFINRKHYTPFRATKIKSKIKFLRIKIKTLKYTKHLKP